MRLVRFLLLLVGSVAAVTAGIRHYGDVEGVRL
jgi:hypothetical protein